jgi:hypothetical protein
VESGQYSAFSFHRCAGAFTEHRVFKHRVCFCCWGGFNELSFLFFFWWYWGLTQGLTLARQALLLLEPLCQPFFVLGIFFLFFLAVLGFELRAFLEPLHQLFFFFCDGYF